MDRERSTLAGRVGHTSSWNDVKIQMSIVMINSYISLSYHRGYWRQRTDDRFGDPPQGGSKSLQWSETGTEVPQEDPLAVHCFCVCVCSGRALLGDLLGVSRSMERDLLSVLSIYPEIFLCLFIVCRRVVRILCLLSYSAIC